MLQSAVDLIAEYRGPVVGSAADVVDCWESLSHTPLPRGPNQQWLSGVYQSLWNVDAVWNAVMCHSDTSENSR